MKQVLIIFLFFVSLSTFAQDPWESWDKNYQEVKYSDILSSETSYAISVEKNPKIAQYYSRLDKYKIKAKYLSKFRSIDPELLNSMKNVFKLFVGNPNQLNETVKNEVLFEIEGKEVWLPIQSILEDALKEEVRKGEKITLYCLFLNEHNSAKVLRNTFFISEFRSH